ncbi:MAG: tRNA (guanosine(37)-N1)-methyltransferase TrmD [Eubacteriales bacterium]|nr:tRNA (guanosine(37)-N1)-methyltransferase TrmD [Eubacteriales bacterium]
MRFSALSLFPEQIRAGLEWSITQRALQQELFELYYGQIRDFAINDYGQVDDKLYAGGVGMLLMPEPIYQSVDAARAAFNSSWSDNDNAVPKEKLIYMSPRGRVLDQVYARSLLDYDHVIILSGHYEGVDQRVLDQCGFEELSVGDYVLTGGELATCVLIDCVIRMIPGVLPSEEAWQGESHASGFLEENQYTRPASWRDSQVPEVLISGHQAKIEAYRQASRIANTLRNRPDLLANKILSEEEWFNFLEQL